MVSRQPSPRGRRAEERGPRAETATDSNLEPSVRAVGGLFFDRGVYDAVVRHLVAALPHEGVGLLATKRAAGVAGVDGTLRVMRFYPGTNIDASSTRFTMDPAEVLDALHDVDEHGWWLGAIVHSHPAGSAVPSATDLREARYPDALMVIAALAERPPRLRAWRVATDGPNRWDGETRGEFTDVPVWIDGEPGGPANAGSG